MSEPKQRRPTLADTCPPPARDSGPYTLTICAPNRGSWSMLIEPHQRYTLGRHPSSSLVLDYPWISEHHAELLGGEPPRIIDLGSRNGTWLDGERLGAREPCALPSGSVVRMGRISMLVTRTEELNSAVFRRASPVAPAVAPVPVNISVTGSASSMEGLVAHDKRMLELCKLVENVAKARMSVLVTGETGVGKELIAQAIHRASQRGGRELVVLNCAAIPETLIESELFGHERGAFSGAGVAKAGMFEAAHGSTFFLDEIGELPLQAQSKLLRVLESGEVLRLGAVRPTRVDVRIIAATNRDLAARISSGAFRADLFYRLNGITLHVPPLRERPDDIEPLARHFARQAGVRAQPTFTPDALETLAGHPFPGNVRELKALIERAAMLAEGHTIDREALLLDPPSERLSLRPRSVLPLQGQTRIPEELSTEAVIAELERRERRQIEEALEVTGGNQKDAAKLLGISRRTLMKRLDRFGIMRPRKRRGGDAE